MNLNPLGILAAVLVIPVFRASYVFFRRAPFSHRITGALLLFPLGALGFLPVLYYSHLLPESAGFYHFRSITGSEFVVLFTAAFLAALSSLFSRVLSIFLFAIAMGIALVPHVKTLIRPLNYSILDDEWDGPVCQQSSASTCGPACSASAVRKLGGNITELDLALAAYSYQGGTEAWYLARELRHHGFESRFRFGEGFWPEAALPAVAGVRLRGGIGHFICLLEKEGQRYLLADPMGPPAWRSRNELEEEYEFTGMYMQISR